MRARIERVLRRKFNSFLAAEARREIEGELCLILKRSKCSESLRTK